MFVFLNQSLLNRFMYGGPNLVTAKKPHRTKINSWFSLFERNVSILSFLTLFVAENVSMPLSKTIKVAGRLVSLSVTLPFKLGKLDHRNQQHASKINNSKAKKYNISHHLHYLSFSILKLLLNFHPKPYSVSDFKMCQLHSK